MKLLKNLATNSMLAEIFPHLSYLAKVSPFDSSWDSISGAKFLLDEDDQNKAEESSWRAKLHLMRIAIETPEKLPDDIVENVVDKNLDVLLHI